MKITMILISLNLLSIANYLIRKFVSLDYSSNYAHIFKFHYFFRIYFLKAFVQPYYC